MEEGSVSDRIERLGEVKSGQNSTVGRFGVLEAIRDRLSEKKNLIKSRPTRTETGLVG